MVKGKEPKASPQKEDYPDLFLPIRENYRISDHFHGYSDSLSSDNNPMFLVELDNLSYRYRTSIYAVDRVNGTMYGKFSVGYRMIPERATVIPQYQHTSVEDEYEPAYENTLPGITNIATPIAKLTPVNQASHIPMTETNLERDIIEVLDVPTTTVVTTTTSTTTPPITLDTELRGTSSPRISLPEGSPSCPTVTATCRPRTWMQQLTEGQTNEPRREDDSSSESNTSVVETLPEDIPDELGHEWRVLHPFDLPGVRFSTDTTPSNQRRLAENDALVELIETTEYFDDVPTSGQRDYRLYPPQYGDLFYRGRGRGGRGRRQWLQERCMDRPNEGFGRGNVQGNNTRAQ